MSWYRRTNHLNLDNGLERGLSMRINWTDSIRQAQLAALEFCSSYTQCAIGVFEVDSDGNIHEFLPQAQFEPYCKLVRGVPKGDQLCKEDHIKRVREIINEKQPKLALCHAGVFNQALPIIVGGKVQSVLLYGQMMISDGHGSGDPGRLLEQTIGRLPLTANQKRKLENSHNNIKVLTKDDLHQLNNQLSMLQQWFYKMAVVDRERGQQTETIIHDLQTRLQPILARAEGLSQNIKLAKTKDAVEESFDELERNSEEHLKHLIAMRVVIWNLENYLPHYHFSPCSLRECVEESVSLYQAEADRKHIELKINIKEPNKVDISRTHMQHTINNLLHNAIKYSFEGRDYLKRFVEVNGKASGYYFFLEVKNYGVGILGDEFEKIFEPGYKGELTKSEYRSGGGMGLSICKDVVDEHKGEIIVKSESKGGKAYKNSFTVKLPIRQS